MRDRPYDEVMVETFREDPAYAAKLLNAILKDGDPDELRVTLRQMNLAFGDGSGQPKDIDGLLSTISAMGCRLSVTPVSVSRKRPAKPGATKRAGRARRPAILAASE